MTGTLPPGSNRTSTANCGSPGELLPPRALQDWVGLGGPAVFKATGDEFLGYLVDLCGLQPSDAVLDVGCGSGRMAVPLIGYLNSEGRYAGFDVSREAIAWCQENISESHPNFDFRVADLKSKRYNPSGKHKTSEFRFPYPDESFDVVLLASIFTHMLPADVKHYMSEIVRVLKPGGRSLITFFLLNEVSSIFSGEGMGQIKFDHEVQGARTANVENPEAAIAYPEAFVRDLYEECGLEIREPLRYGNWCGRMDGMSGQDVVIAVKAASGNQVQMIDIERPNGSTKYPLIPVSDENLAFAEAMGVNPAIHENDFIFHFVDRHWGANGGRERAVKNYFELGRYTADLTKTMIADVQKVYELLEWEWAPRRVLDFASGYGCTARHMRHVFSESDCATCDIHIDALQFNKDVLGVESYISSPVPEQLKLPPQDVIFAHSFFSHMPETTWARWLKALANALAPRGVLIFTTHGFVLDKQGIIPGLNVEENGFGFIPQSEQDDLKGEEYGLTISTPRWVLPVLASMPELRLSKFHEGLWWGTQDTYVCVKETSPVAPASTPNHPTAPASLSIEEMPRMSAAAAEEYIASLYATVLKRDPRPDEFAGWVATAAALPPEQVYFAFVNSKEHKRQLEQSVPSMFSPGHYYSPIVDPSTIAEYVEKQYLQEPGDIEGIVFDEDAMVRFWKENAEFIKNTPFSDHDDGKNRFYYDNDNFPYADAITLRAMIAHFKPKNVIEIGSGFSSACMLDAVDHVGLSDFTMTCIDPDADRLRSRLREEDRSRVEIIEGLVQDVPVSTFAKLKENDILFIDSTHVLKTASDVHYELFSILPSLNKGVLVHFHDIQYPFEYPRQWLFDSNYSWNEIYALRAFLMYNSAFEVVFWNGLFAHRQRELVQETNPLFLKNSGGSMWLRARSVDILQTQHAQIGVTGGPQVKMNEFLHGLRPNLAVSDGDTMYSAAAARHYEFVGRSDLSVVLNALNLRATHPGGDAAISDVFDFGCGHGRATRWFRAAFPEAAIWVTDYDQAGVDWCVKQFGCKDTGGEIPADRFDVVWLGSVFTHLPRQIVEGLIDNLLKSLKPNGLLIFTTQGRFAVGMMEAFLTSSDVPGWMHYDLERDSVEDLIRQYNEEGYGFVNYPHQTDYGVCVAKSHWYSDRILKHDRYIQILMEEKGSDNHQDVHAFMRAYLSDLGKGPLY